MKHKLAYCDYLINRGTYKQAVTLLQGIDDPAAHEYIYQLGLKTQISGRIRKLIVQALIELSTARSNQLLLDYHLEFAIKSYSMIVKLPKTGDARIVDALADEITAMLDRKTLWRTGLFVAMISALGEFQSPKAIPVLTRILDKYPLTHDTLTANATSYANHAYLAMRKIDAPSTADLLDSWYDNFVTIVRDHIREDTLIWQNESRFRVSWYLQSHPDIVDYIIRKFINADTETKRQLLRGVILRMMRSKMPAEQLERLLNGVIDYIVTIEDDKDRHKLIQRIHYVDSPRIIAFMEDLFFTDETTTLAVQVFVARKHQTPQITERLISLVENDQIVGFGLGMYMDYLVMVDTPETDAVIVRYAQRDPAAINVRLANTTLGKIAHRNPLAYQHLIDAIDSPHKSVADAAIYSLGTVGLPALPILLSLLQPDDNRIRSAISALGKPIFAPAIPHLINILISGQFPATQNVIRSLKAIGTDDAFAAINAWARTTTRNR